MYKTKIENFKKQLYKLIDQKPDLFDSEIIRISQELNFMVNEYLKMKIK